MELNFLDLESYHYFFIAAVVVLGCLYLYDAIYEVNCQPPRNLEFTSYNYSEGNGPSFWNKIFSKANGNLQSPINILETRVEVISSDEACPLIFSEEFHIVPAEMKLYNNSHNVVLYASWPNCTYPTIVGGPLEEEYRFVNLRLRWGSNDFEGSEHMINSVKFAMELQAAFVKKSSCQEDILTAATNKSLVMLSYFFMVTPIDNPYFEPMITALRYLKRPMSYICIEPITLSLLTPDFTRDYYTYMGSLTFPPCTEGVRWIIKPEPLMISSRQVKQFRKLYGCEKRIDTNTRPVQSTNDREVIYYS
ncbi:carbonic anhydrase 13-like [Diorhabda carinulata]|uniref:carbonic anhydrase 13-like n=1 Tax=Diorhabda carinulata TaxID=1163345 RepID=UPI0025A03A47|nr:carbonic anhydrase 13-like [Diorhabda carinulata]